MNRLEQQVKDFLANQKQTWQLAQDNYLALDKIQLRRLQCMGREVLLQFNPERIRSSAAKVDKASLDARPCFFCHRPKEQQSILYNKDFEILVNPYPIFQEHLTIPLLRHEQQQIKPYLGDMLDLAKELPSYALFYNGPKCGASAPDHMHFQAAIRDGFPIVQAWKQIDKQEICEKDGVLLYTLKKTQPTSLFFLSNEKEKLVELFDSVYDLLDIREDEYEPRMNLLTWIEDNQWVVCLYPRRESRPACFYREGEANILVSPATVEMSGLFIFPLEKDFVKVSSEDIQTIWEEVSISKEQLENLICQIKRIN